MTAPYPLDWQPPYVAARWQRSTHRSWAGLRYPQMGVLHSTEGGKGAGQAESGAGYNARRADSVSCHVLVDDDSIVQSVMDRDVSFSAGQPWNDIGLQVEMCGNAKASPVTTSAQWGDPHRFLELVAWYMAKANQVFGIPIAFVYAEDMAAQGFAVGWTTHYEITQAEKLPGAVRSWFAANGITPSNSHVDPGHEFYPPYPQRDQIAGYPLGEVLRLARDYVGAPPQPGGEDVNYLWPCSDAGAVFYGPFDGKAGYSVRRVTGDEVALYQSIGVPSMPARSRGAFKNLVLDGAPPEAWRAQDPIYQGWDDSHFAWVNGRQPVVTPPPTTIPEHSHAGGQTGGVAR